MYTNNDPNSLKPTLVEGSIKYTLVTALAECHRYKLQHYNFLFNLAIVCFLVFIIALVLLIKYRGKPSKEEIAAKEYKKKEYILSRIQNFQDAAVKKSQGLLTGLPNWN